MTRMPCVICGEPADHFALHYSGDPWERDAPYKVALCRDHQRELIAPVQEAVRNMKEEREVARG